MNKLRHILLFSVVFCLSAVAVFAQSSDSAITRKELNQSEINRIIKNFTTKEGEFRDSLKSYVFNRSAVIQTIGLGGQITGEYRRDSFMTFSESGGRFEKILFAPTPTLTEISVTPEDLDDLGGINPFALEPSVVNLYNFNYVGKERIDELDLYIFDVSPKVMPDPKKSKQRVFVGRVWVDDRDLQIVKSKGKAGPETRESKFPVVETWRENTDGKYWFPAYSSSNDQLVFDNGQVTNIRVRVTYSDYRLGRSDVRVLDDEEPVKEETPQPTPTPAATPKKP